MVATYVHTTELPAWAWDASETVCDGCGHRLASRAARIVSYGPTAPDGTSADRPRVFHRIQCANGYFDAQTLASGLRDLAGS